MPLVIDTYNDYYFYLQYRRRAVQHTIKANKLALQYFSSLYGHMETQKLLPTHMVRFHEFLLNKKRLQKNDKGEFLQLSRYSVYKTMGKVRAYVKWLETERYL
jgi:site-specific recombinase XerD